MLEVKVLRSKEGPTLSFSVSVADVLVVEAVAAGGAAAPRAGGQQAQAGGQQGAQESEHGAVLWSGVTRSRMRRAGTSDAGVLDATIQLKLKMRHTVHIQM